MSAAMALTSGTKLGTYEIIGLLGAGGMGEVYRARDRQLGRDVAIKILPAFLSRDPDRLRRFEQEARAAAALNHPNILAVYQMGMHEGTPYLVSELLEGSTLRERLARGPLAARKAVEYAAQTAHGLAAAHEKGIVHRDLKPENLFVTNDGRLKILDFGLAKLIQKPTDEPSAATVSGQTEPGVVLGTVGYMSPEQVRGHAADHRADLFALGAILYEMLTGKRSFHKPTSAETMSAILNEEPPPVSQIVPGIPPALQRVVQRCLEKSPEQRFHSASDLAFALEALSDSGVSVSGPQGSSKKSRLTWQAIIAASAAVVLLAAVTLWWARPSAVPVVESVVQLTNDPNAKSGTIETDGARIYFTLGQEGSMRLAQVSVGGGQIAEVATQLNNPQIVGLNRDGSKLLLLVSPYLTNQGSQMWLLPLPAGEARRLTDLQVDDASLFPGGRLLYFKDHSLYMAERDGSNPRKLEALSQYGVAPNISPDGRRLVFSSDDKTAQVSVIHEASSDGTGIRDVLRGNTQNLPAGICCGHWTPDEKYLIFAGANDGRYDLWAVRDQKRFFGGASAPVRLTNGPLSYTTFVPSRDGKQIFAIGSQKRGELVRFDSRLHEFVPFLGGISALDPTFSQDGQWVTYVSYPERALWRSRADGSERLQLTYPPMSVGFARISPDGKQVAFSDSDGVCNVVSASGGTPQKLSDRATAPDWSPDGNLLAVTSWFPDSTASGGGYFELRIVDLRTRQVSTVPDSREKIGPWFVSSDKMIALTQDQSKFEIFDLKTQKWSDIISSPGQFITWETSADGKYFLYAAGGNDPKIFRMKLSDHSIEEVASLKNFASVGDPALSVSPDDSAVLTRNVGTQEVYALTIKWP
jgi:serine/threonine protein kinase/WD40 repeat protein